MIEPAALNYRFTWELNDRRRPLFPPWPLLIPGQQDLSSSKPWERDFVLWTSRHRVSPSLFILFFKKNLPNFLLFFEDFWANNVGLGSHQSQRNCLTIPGSSPPVAQPERVIGLRLRLFPFSIFLKKCLKGTRKDAQQKSHKHTFKAPPPKKSCLKGGWVV